MWRKAIVAIALVAIGAMLLVTASPVADAENDILYKDEEITITLVDVDGSKILYDTDGENKIKQHLHVAYNSGSVITDYDLTGAFTAVGEQTISVVIDNKVYPIELTIVENKIESLKKTEDFPTKTYHSGDSLASVSLDVRDYLIAVFSDGSEKRLDASYDLYIQGSLYSGSDGSRDDAVLSAYIRSNINHTVSDNFIPLEFTVNITPMYPHGITDADAPSTFYSGDLFNVTSLTVLFSSDIDDISVDMSTLDITQYENYLSTLSFTYYDKNGEVVSLDEGNHLTVDVTKVEVTYKENNVITKPREFAVDVLPIEVDVPILYNNSETYNSTYHSTTVSGFNPDYMKITSTNLYSDENGTILTDALLSDKETFEVYAKNAGDYFITFELTNNNYVWKGLADTEREATTDTWTILKATITGASIELKGWEYSDAGPHNPIIKGVPDDAFTDDSTFEPVYYYWGQANDGTTILETNATDTQPSLAGEWHVKITIESVNYIGVTLSDSFTIFKKVISAEEYHFSFDYTGSEIDLSSIVQSKPFSVSTDSNYDYKAENRGEYNALLLLTDTNNYCWERDSEADSKEITWYINTAQNEVDSQSITGWRYLDKTLSKEELLNLLNSKIIVEPKFDTTFEIKLYKDLYFSQEANINGDGQYDAGTYWIKVVFDADRSGNDNFSELEWEFRNSITISPCPIEVLDDVDAGSKPYTGEPQQSDLSSGKYYTVDQEYHEDAGSYHVYVTINDNFTWNMSNPPVDGTLTLNFTITKITGSYSVLWNEWTTPSDLVYGSTGSLTAPTANSEYGIVVIKFWTVEDPDSSWDGTIPLDAKIWDSVTQPHDAGNYRVVACVEETKNYIAACTSDFKSFTISKKPVSVPIFDEDFNPEYNGSAVIITSDNFQSWREFFEIIDGDNYVNHSPTGYILKVRITDSNYCWSEGEAGVEIAGDTASIPWNISKRIITLSTNDIRNVVISSSQPHPTLTLVNNTTSRETLTFGDGITVIWSSDRPEVGKEVYAKLTIDDEFANNFGWGLTELDSDDERDYIEDHTLYAKYLFVKDDFTITVKWTDTTETTLDFTYDGEEHKFVKDTDFTVTVNDGKGTISEIETNVEIISYTSYYRNSDGSWKEAAIKNAGEYSIRFQTASSANYGSAEYTLYVSVEKKQIGSSIIGNLMETYDGKDQLETFVNGKVFNVCDGDQHWVEWKYTDNEGNPIEYLSDVVDNKVINYTISAGDNYLPFTGIFSVTIKPFGLEVSAENPEQLSSDYDGNTPDLSDVKLIYTDGKNPRGNDNPEITIRLKPIDGNTHDAHTYDIVASTDDPNYTVVFNSKQNYVITTDIIEDIWVTVSPVLNLTYNGSGQSVISSYSIDTGRTNDTAPEFAWYVCEGDGQYVPIDSFSITDAGLHSITVKLISDNYDKWIHEYKDFIYIDYRDLTITATDHSIYYGDSEFSYSAEEFIEFSIPGFDFSNEIPDVSLDVSDDYDYNDPISSEGVSYSVTPSVSGVSTNRIIGNYDVKFVSGDLNVSPRPIVLTFDYSSFSSVYSDMSYAAIISSLFYNSEVVSGIPDTSDIYAFEQSEQDVLNISLDYDSNSSTEGEGNIWLDAGDYHVSVSVDSNYDLDIKVKIKSSDSEVIVEFDSDQHMYVVTPKALPASVNSSDMVYNGEDHEVTITIADGPDVSYSIQYRYYNDQYWDEIEDKDLGNLAESNWGSWSIDKPNNAGIYQARAVVDENSNYSITVSNAQFKVTKATFEGLTGIEYDLERQYDPDSNSGVEISGQIILAVDEDGDQYKDKGDVNTYLKPIITYRQNGESTTPSDVGTYDVTITFSSLDQNYNDPTDVITKSFVITPCEVKAIWIHGDSWTKTYDGNALSPSTLISYVLGPSGSHLPEGAYQVSELGSKEIRDSQKYTVKVELIDSESGNYSQNYTIVNPEFTFSITPVENAIQANQVDSTFGDVVYGKDNTLDYGFSFTDETDQDIRNLFNNELKTGKGNLSYALDSTVLNGHTTFNDYVNANIDGEVYSDAISVSYTGKNFDVTPIPGDLYIKPLSVKIDLEDQTCALDELDDQSVSSDKKYYKVELADRLSSYLDVRISLSKTDSISDIYDIEHAGRYELTASCTNPNYTLYVDKGGVLIVTSATNDWDIDAGFPQVNGWTYLGFTDEKIKWPVSLYGTVTASIQDTDITFTKDTQSDVLIELPAGNYTLMFSVAAEGMEDGYCDYTGITGVTPFNFTVDKKPLSPSWDEDYFEFDENSHKVTLKDYDSDLMYYAALDENVVPIETDEGIVMEATLGGTYGIELFLKDSDNYCWDSPLAEGEVLRLEWSIGGQIELTWDEQNMPSISSTWVFGDNPEFNPGSLAGDYDLEIRYEYYKTEGDIYCGIEVPADVGTYYMKAFVEETDSYKGLELKVDFEITTRYIDRPVVDSTPYLTFEEGKDEYDLTEEEWFVNWYEDVENYVSYAGNIASGPGNYTMLLYINDYDNCQWSPLTKSADAPEVISIPWVVSTGGPLSKDMFSVDVSDEIYTGHPIVKEVSSSLVEGKDYVVSYSDNSDVGPVLITITGINSYDSQLNYEFTIVPATEQPEFYNEQLKMYVEDSSFYNALQLPSYIDKSLLTYSSSDPSIATVDPHTGAITMNATGSVTITASYPGTANYSAGSATYELTVSDTPVEVVDHVVYIRVPVTDPDDPDDPTDDKPDEPAIVYKNDNTLYIILLLVLAVICVCFAAYIMYTHRKQENQGGGQR